MKTGKSPSDNGRITIPGDFFKTLTEDEGIDALMAGQFNAELCVRLWHFLGRQDRPPPSLALGVSKADVLRNWPFHLKGDQP